MPFAHQQGIWGCSWKIIENDLNNLFYQYNFFPYWDYNYKRHSTFRHACCWAYTLSAEGTRSLCHQSVINEVTHGSLRKIDFSVAMRASVAATALLFPAAFLLLPLPLFFLFNRYACCISATCIQWWTSSQSLFPETNNLWHLSLLSLPLFPQACTNFGRDGKFVCWCILQEIRFSNK